jgi:hypothetical protein
LVERRSHNPEVGSSILPLRIFRSIKYITYARKSITEMHDLLNAVAQRIIQLNASVKFLQSPIKCISQMQTTLQSNADKCISQRISQIQLVICSISQKHSNASVKCITVKDILKASASQMHDSNITQMHHSNARVKCTSQMHNLNARKGLSTNYQWCSCES